MHVSVVIVGYRNPGDITACLRALDRSDYADFEVVICENGGAVAFAELQAAVPATLAGGQHVTLVSAPQNPGFAGGVNIGITATPQADAWWVLNPDTEPMPGAMAAMVARLARGDVDATGGILVASTGAIQAYGGHWRTWLARAISIGYGNAPGARVDPADIERRQNYIVGASMMVTRRFVDVAGPIREDYFLYCEEVEWGVRGLQHGLKLGFTPDAVVMHHQGTTTGSGGAVRARSRFAVYLGARNTVLITRDLYPWRAPVATLAAVGMAAMVYLRRGAFKQFGWALSGIAAALRNERDQPGWMR